MSVCPELGHSIERERDLLAAQPNENYGVEKMDLLFYVYNVMQLLV